MIQFTYPDKMENDQLERLLTAIEGAISNGSFGTFVTDTFREAITEHGIRAIHELIGSYFASWCEACSEEDPPRESYYRDRAREHLLAVDEEAALQELVDFRRDLQRYLGNVAERCLGCGRIRHGIEWQDKPTPDGWCEIFTECPECESPKASSYEEPAEPTDDDLRAWLAEGDLAHC